MLNLITSVIAAAASITACTTRHGLGVDEQGRTILAPHASARVILVDPSGANSGPTTVDGRTTYVRTSVGAALGVARSGAFGDWVLVKGGVTLTTYPGDLPASVGGSGPMNGQSAQYPSVFGTYDPTDPYNWSKANRQTVEWRPTTTSGNNFFRMFMSGIADVAVVGWHMYAPPSECGQITVAQGGGLGAKRMLVERCYWDHLQWSVTGDYLFPTTGAGGDMVNLTTNAAEDCTFRHCGAAFANDLTGGRYSNLYIGTTRRTRVERCVFHHGGWSESHTRSTPPWNGTSGAGPDTYKHVLYATIWNSDLQVIDCIFSWDASNSKVGGDNAVIDGLIEIRNPFGCVVGGNNEGNEITGFPGGYAATVRRHVHIHSDDINYSTAATCGWGIWMASLHKGATYTRGLILRVANPTTINRMSWLTWATNGLNSTVAYAQSTVVSWAAPVTLSQNGGTASRTTTGCLTHEASSGTNLEATAALAAKGLSSTRTMLTFAAEQGITVSGATDLDKEGSALLHMARNAHINWHPRLAGHIRSEVWH